MPSNRVHCAISKKRTGHDFQELHHWMDEPSARLGYDHRLERHTFNQKDEKHIREYWDKKGGLGEKAVVEWLFHIALDNISTAFKKSRNVYGDNTYNFFIFGLSQSGYIHLDFKTLIEDKLEEEFGGDHFKDDELI